MPVRIARVELQGVQALVTDEGRRWVEQHVPGRSGSVFQQLGRGSVSLRLEGLLLGEDALEKLESLRRAQADAKPVPFAADVLSGLDLTDVLIDTLHVRQVAGYRHRYWYRLEVREHVEEPPPVGAALGSLQAGVDADAASWADGAVGASAAVQDITALPALAAVNPEVLEHLSQGDLENALGKAAGALDGPGLDRIANLVGVDSKTLGAIVAKLQDVQLSDVYAAVQAIRDPSSIPALLAQNPGMLDRLGVSDLGRALASKADALTGGQFSEALQALGKVDPAKVVALVEDLRKAGSLGEFVEKLASGGVDLLEDLTGIDLGEARIIIEGVQGAADFLTAVRRVGDEAGAVVEALRAYDPLAPVRGVLGEAAGGAVDIVQAVGRLVTAVGGLLESKTAEAVLLLARKLGAEAQLDAAVDLVVDGIDEAHRLLEGAREPLKQLAAVSGLVALADALVSATARLAEASGEDLAMLGLEEAKDATGPLAKALDTGSGVLRGGRAVLDSAPTPESITGLQERLGGLRGQVLAYRTARRKEAA
jgi:hypothetical protein